MKIHNGLNACYQYIFVLELRNGVIVVVYRDLRWRPRQEVEMPWAWRTRVSGRTSQTRVGRRTSQLEPMPAPAVSPLRTSTTKSPSLRISRYPPGGERERESERKKEIVWERDRERDRDDRQSLRELQVHVCKFIPYSKHYCIKDL